MIMPTKRFGMWHSRLVAGAVVGVLGVGAMRLDAAPPVYDHVVIVIEENHSFTNVIGNPDAPFMNQLATQGTLCTNMYGLVHPSQPNYLHLFSGANQGMASNDVPPLALRPFSTPNLGAAIIASGDGSRTFIGYSEDLPSVGSDVEISGQYWRKHNPWVNWQVVPPLVPGANQFSSLLNRPFTDFPSDFSQLPTVAIVVPNQDHDMHDGTIAMADEWLTANLGAYAAWCGSHNSLLVITWDEDSFASRNHIPTMFYGAHVRTGVDASRRTLHDLLRTVCAMYGAAAPGAAADVEPMVGLFDTDPVVQTVRFQHGVSGYAGCVDTWIESANPAATHAADTLLVADGSPASQVLLRFDGVLGTLAGQVPPEAVIHSAKLSLLTGVNASDASASGMSVHRLLVGFDATSTWSSLGAGVSTGIEADLERDFSTEPRTSDVWEVLDVTDSVRTWHAGATNLGWVVIPAGTDGWRLASSEAAIDQRPVLEIAYSVPTCGPCLADYDCSGHVSVNDLFAFLAGWFAGETRADMNGMDGVSVQDIFVFLERWFAGC